MKVSLIQRYAIFSAFLFLSGCAGLVPDALQERLDQSGDADKIAITLQFAVEDAEAAHRLAVAVNDEPAMACWPAVKRYAEFLRNYRESAEAVETEGADGVFVTYQRARAIRRRLGDGLPEYVTIACAAMAEESRSFVKGLVLRLGAL